MDAFEEIVAGLFKQLGYWTRVDYKVRLSKKQKVKLGKPSMPRPEIDLLAYKPAKNLLLWIECKSYLDSRGVKFGSIESGSNRFRVFTKKHFRQIVSAQLLKQLASDGLILGRPKLQYVLVGGHIASELDRVELGKHFRENGWLFYDDHWIREQLYSLSKSGYENELIILLAKILKSDS